jgi:hypothetical protein
MKLATLSSSNSQAYWGTTNSPIDRGGATTIGRLPNDSEFLLLVPEIVSPLVEQESVPEGFIFTYCQAWGLSITEEVIDRVWNDLRSKAYPPATDYLDGLVKGNAQQTQKYISDCLAVKAKYSKI